MLSLNLCGEGWIESCIVAYAYSPKCIVNMAWLHGAKIEQSICHRHIFVVHEGLLPRHVPVITNLSQMIADGRNVCAGLRGGDMRCSVQSFEWKYY